MHKLRQVALYIALVVSAVIFLVPVLWLVLLAIRPPAQAASPLNLVFTPTFESFAYVLKQGGATSLLASTIQSAAATLIAIPMAILASYGLTRWRFRGQQALSFWYLGLMLAPPVVFVIPLFIALAQLQLIGTHWAPIIAFQTFAIPLGVLLLRSFFEEFPVALEEAAMMDGCGRLRILLLVFLPIMRPALLVASIFVFCFSWNNLLFVMPLTSGGTVPLTVRSLSFFATSGINWTYIGATAVISMIVPMTLFFIFRRHLVSGLTFGAVK